MRKIYLFLPALFIAAALALTPGPASAQGDGSITTAVIDAGVFVTVRETTQGDLLSLYRVAGDRIILVDVVVNSIHQSGMRMNLPKRYLHRLDVENK